MITAYMIQEFVGWLFLFWVLRKIFSEGFSNFVAVIAAFLCLLEYDSGHFSLGEFCAAVLWLVFL